MLHARFALASVMVPLLSVHVGACKPLHLGAVCASSVMSVPSRSAGPERATAPSTLPLSIVARTRSASPLRPPCCLAVRKTVSAPLLTAQFQPPMWFQFQFIWASRTPIFLWNLPQRGFSGKKEIRKIPVISLLCLLRPDRVALALGTLAHRCCPTRAKDGPPAA